MSEIILSIKMNAKERPIQTKVNRMGYLHRIKVIEVISEHQEYFYLLFYKDQFISGGKTELRKNCQINKLFQKGIVFTTPHPLIDAFLNQHQIYDLKPIDQLPKSLSRKFTSQEISLILFYFDAFFPQEKIVDTIKEFFYNYRRNGQLRLAFQIIIVILSFDQKNKWALDMSNQLDFLKYKARYAQNEPVLLEDDPLFMESFYFKNKNRKFYFEQLQAILTQKSKWIDQVALYIDHFSHSTSVKEKHYNAFTNLLSEHFSATECTLILWESYKKMTLDEKMTHQLIDGLLNLDMFEEAINVITDHRQNTNAYRELMFSLLAKKTLQIHKINLEHLRYYLLDELSPPNIDALLDSIIPRLLDEFDIDYVYKWLKPIYQLELQIPILDTIQMMVSIKDDPDQQFSLGKLYHQTKQYRKAIECFNWEMELNPQDPNPVQWLIKLYRELGMIEESNNYLYIYESMQKASS